MFSSPGHSQFVKIAFLGIAPARTARFIEVGQLDCVAVEVEQRQAAVLAIDLLTVTIQHDHPRAFIGDHQGTAFGHHGNGLVGDPVVVNQDAAQLAAARALANEYGDAVGHGVEDPFLQQNARVIVADIALQVFEGSIGRRKEVERDGVDGRGCQNAEHQCRFGQLQLR